MKKFGMLLLLSACAGRPAPVAPVAEEARVSSTPAVTPEAKKDDGPSEEGSPIPITRDDPTWGSRTALVTIVELSDLECPFCARAEKTMAALKEKYGAEQLRIVWKHHPLDFHGSARAAAEWAQGVYGVAGSGPFFCFASKAFDGQRRLSRQSFQGWATDCGVSAALVDKSVDARRWTEKIDQDIKLANKLGADGTPTFFVNGVEIRGAQPIERFTRVIDEQLSIAKQLIDKGVTREQVYVVISKVMREADKEADEEDTKTVFRIPLGQSPQRGVPTAAVTIVEFSDFQCPFCKKAEETLALVRAKYGDKVRIVWKDEPLPFHPRAEPAAELAREARAQKGDRAFWDAHDLLFNGQLTLEDDDLAAIAQKLGLNVAKVKDALKAHRYQKQIDADADLADDFDANGTPHFFINGRRLVGAQPLEKFQTIIDEELKRADETRARGVAAAQLYDELTKNGKGPRVPEKRTVAAAQDAPWRGAANATVTIQEFSDFQCPFCQRVEPTLAELLKAYPGRIKIVWRHMPLPMHDDASLAAQAAMEAYKQKGNEGFWKMHDVLYANQKDLKRDALDGYAQKLGLDMARWKAALDSGAHKAAIDEDAKKGSDARVNGTPAFFINGYFISGAQPLGRFRKAVDLALADASKH